MSKLHIRTPREKLGHILGEECDERIVAVCAEFPHPPGSHCTTATNGLKIRIYIRYMGVSRATLHEKLTFNTPAERVVWMCGKESNFR
jgi:hypothetical protein